MKDHESVSPYLTKDAFHKFELSNIERQDTNKDEILGAIEKNWGKRVERLEDDARKQTALIAAIAAIGTMVAGAVSGTIAYFSRFGGT